MKEYIVKQLEAKALDVDTGTKQVKVVLSSMGNLDRDNDVIAPGAFTKTISERGPNGTNEIWHLVDHRASLQTALGKFKELYVENNQLIGVSQYKDTTLWNQIWPLYEAGDINQHSIGFSIINSDYKQDGVRVITEVALWEGSSVLWGANPATPTLELQFDGKDSVTLAARVENLTKSLKAKNFDKELFNIELLQLKDLLSEAEKATRPEPTTLPEAKRINWDMVAALINL